MYKEVAKANQQKALEIIKTLKIAESWAAIGAEINLVGSLRMGLLCKHLDIDFHIYTPTLDVLQSFKAVSNIAKNPKIIRVEMLNLEDYCLEWHAFYRDDELWQIDMIHILKGSKYDGFFEKQADAIVEKMSEKQKELILRLKYETPQEIKIAGIEYYQAVLQGGVRNLEELLEWRDSHAQEGIIEWMP